MINENEDIEQNEGEGVEAPDVEDLPQHPSKTNTAPKAKPKSLTSLVERLTDNQIAEAWSKVSATAGNLKASVESRIHGAFVSVGPILGIVERDLEEAAAHLGNAIRDIEHGEYASRISAIMSAPGRDARSRLSGIFGIIEEIATRQK